jgi:N4-gp56 family major capsid protein
MPTFVGNSTATPNFDKTVTALVLRRIEQNLRDNSVYMQEGAFVKGDLIPGTNLIRHVAYSDLSVTTNANVVTPGTTPWLQEGIPPTDESLAIFYEEYAAQQAGRTLAITDVALAQSPHNLMAVAAERIGINAGQTIDLFVGNILNAGMARVLYAAGTTRVGLAATNVMTGALIRRAVATLKAANVDPFPDGTYHAFIHPYVLYDLQADATASGWVEVSKYAQPDQLLTGEIGKYMGVRFIESNVGNLFVNAGTPTAVDVFSTFIFGPDSFAFGDLQSVQAFLVSPGGDHMDPLAQKAVVGWKAMWGAKLLGNAGGFGVNFAKYLRIESASSIGNNAT